MRGRGPRPRDGRSGREDVRSEARSAPALAAGLHRQRPTTVFTFGASPGHGRVEHLRGLMSPDLRGATRRGPFRRTTPSCGSSRLALLPHGSRSSSGERAQRRPTRFSSRGSPRRRSAGRRGSSRGPSPRRRPSPCVTGGSAMEASSAPSPQGFDGAGMARLSSVQRPLLGTVVSGRFDERAQSRVGYFATTVPLVVEVGSEASFMQTVEALEPMRLGMLSGEVPDLAALDGQGGPSVAQSMRVVYVHQNTTPIALPSRPRRRAGARSLPRPGTDRPRRQQQLAGRPPRPRLGSTTATGSAPSRSPATPTSSSTRSRSSSRGRSSPWPSSTSCRPPSARCGAPTSPEGTAVDFELDVVRAHRGAGRGAPGSARALRRDQPATTYGALSEKVDALSHALEMRGVARGDRVAVLTDRSADYVIALLACFKLAAVAVPLDPALPRERVEQIIEDGAVSPPPHDPPRGPRRRPHDGTPDPLVPRRCPRRWTEASGSLAPARRRRVHHLHLRLDGAPQRGARPSPRRDQP